MININGVCTSAKIFSDSIEDYAAAQIKMLCDNEAFKDSKIRVMPDVHPGKVGTIGFTATIKDRILPNVVGIDIGCGVTMVKVNAKKIEMAKLDKVIRENIPSGFSVRKKTHRFWNAIDLMQLHCARHISTKKAELALGSLGSGNHFIEVDMDSNGEKYIVVHSGSRYLGKAVTEYYLEQGQKFLKEKGMGIPYEMTWLEGPMMQEYLEDIQIVQEYAALNREAMIDEIIKGMKLKAQESYSCHHNYVEVSKNQITLRKGAISAKANEYVIIPVNMRDGIILGYGRGNEDWNCSAPHGAGRIMKREDVKTKYTVSAFKNEMKGIYTTCIGKDTLDEAPFAYRGMEEIVTAIQDTVYVHEIIRPIYNYKSGGKE